MALASKAKFLALALVLGPCLIGLGLEDQVSVNNTAGIDVIIDPFSRLLFLLRFMFLTFFYFLTIFYLKNRQVKVSPETSSSTFKARETN